jgi:hypothetical protein
MSTSNHSSRPPSFHRTISQVLRVAREREESETLLGEDTPADRSGCLINDTPTKHNPHAHLPVYKNIHRIRRLMLASIDDPYSLEQLMSPRINVAIVRPLTDRLFDADDISIVYCLLVNRQRFLKDQDSQIHHQTVNITRATLCELVATRILRKFNEDNPTRAGLLLLANVMVASFGPFQNCPEEMLIEHRHLLDRHLESDQPAWDKMTNALEVAILTESKGFLGSTAARRVVEALYYGRIVYTPNSIIDIIPDRYKRKGVTLYDPRQAPLLNHYRLIVPRTRAVLEFVQYVILLGLYAATMISRDQSMVTGWEITFMIYGCGWFLEEVASVLEHGWRVHSQNLWSFLDLTFAAIFTVYMVVRAHGLAVGDEGVGVQALDVLACAAPIMFPRVAFNLMPESLLFIALRTMMKDFLILTAVAAWCFCGFLFAMNWLSRWRGAEDVHIPPIEISKWMLWIWFGLDGTGIEHSVDFHLILGPILMVSFAFLGNTLFLTILVSMLSNTFSQIANDAGQEIQFRRSVLTFEGVKSDAVFAYRPPFNLLAVLIMVPLRFVLTERWFHKIHVAAVRILNAPMLLVISLYERKRLWPQRKNPAQRSRTSFLHWNAPAHRDLEDVFDLDPPQILIDEIEEEDVVDEDILGIGYIRTRSLSPGNERNDGTPRRRRFSSVGE